VKILTSKTCPACKGQKQQEHPLWADFHAMRKVWTETEFFLDLGYLPDEPRPPKKIPCRACRGLGEVEDWQTLDVFWPNLRAWLRKFKKAIS
jgi:DnaJ-class molecular chaperone